MVPQSINRLGLYVHVPFCAQKCSYCDFPSWGGQMSLRQPYVDKVAEEIAARAAEVPRQTADTVYLGGGTPSLLKPSQLTQLLEALRAGYSIAPDAEITCEANPGMVTEGFLAAAAAGGVNRLSLGAQASQTDMLRLLGRQHTWRQVEETVDLVASRGITNINVDLMFGLPGQTEDQWADTLRLALQLPVTHLSCYGLIPEEGTALQARLASGVLSLPEVEAERRMYDLARAMLAEHGFVQYEISNFAKPGFHCRHNEGCWTRVPYLGFGCAAHSLVGRGERRQNPMSLEGYLRGEAAQTQALTREEQMFETMMLGLRMTRGVTLKAFEDTYGIPLGEVYGSRLAPSLTKGLAVLEDGYLRLTDRGMDLMNAVLLDLME